MAARKGTPSGSKGSQATTIAHIPSKAPVAPPEAIPGTLQVPDEGPLALVTEFEGFRAEPYPDPGSGGDPWTYGYGATRDPDGNPVTARTPPITEARAALLALRDLKVAIREIQGDVKVPLTPNECSALEDFIFNLGTTNFRHSTLLRKLNAGDYEGAAAEFPKWDMAGGRVMAGLCRRRAAEKALFEKA